MSKIMNIKEFTEHPQVFHLVRSLKEDKVHEKQFSDVLDGDGNQDVELVQEGGGVLGVALIGYTYVLEQMGLRFFSLAGTSAGSINSMLLAGFGDISKPKSDKLISQLVNKDLYEFVDGDKDAKRFIGNLVEGAGRIKMVWNAMQVLDNLFDDLGLNPGDDFFNWLAGILEKEGVRTTRDLYDHFGKIPETLKIREGIDKSLEGLQPRIAMVAADIMTETKVEFPRMRSLYWANPDNINPATYVRASMSIPYFFRPLTIRNIPKGPEAMTRWEQMVDFVGDLPDEVMFVDGGILSNFPIDLFHKKNSVPRMPTFGVRLGVTRNEANKVNSPLNLFGAIFNSIRHLHDYDFILRNPDYEKLVQSIDIGHHDWLNFAIAIEDKKDLFYRGAKAAGEFLRKFEWLRYKEIRGMIKTPEK